MANDLIQFGESKQTMSSLEIAKLTGKPHNDVMKAIRAMEIKHIYRVFFN